MKPWPREWKSYVILLPDIKGLQSPHLYVLLKTPILGISKKQYHSLLLLLVTKKTSF
jgi:hypothetical protein